MAAWLAKYVQGFGLSPEHCWRKQKENQEGKEGKEREGNGKRGGEGREGGGEERKENDLFPQGRDGERREGVDKPMRSSRRSSGDWRTILLNCAKIQAWGCAISL